MEMNAGRKRPRPPEPSTVVAYDAAWPDFFKAMRERLRALFVGSEAVIEHVGSTAVPGLAAKPIVDIDAVVPSSADIPDAVRRLESGGYIYRGNLGIPGREAFDVLPELPYHHLYVVAAGTKPHLDHVLLRDHLRTYPDDAERYGRRRLDVAHLITAESRRAYMEAKASIVEELLAVARREFALYVTLPAFSDGSPRWCTPGLGAGAMCRAESESVRRLCEPPWDPRRLSQTRRASPVGT